jgi:hypothetical protein
MNPIPLILARPRGSHEFLGLISKHLWIFHHDEHPGFWRTNVVAADCHDERILSDDRGWAPHGRVADKESPARGRASWGTEPDERISVGRGRPCDFFAAQPPDHDMHRRDLSAPHDWAGGGCNALTIIRYFGWTFSSLTRPSQRTKIVPVAETEATTPDRSLRVNARCPSSLRRMRSPTFIVLLSNEKIPAGEGGASVGSWSWQTTDRSASRV